MRGKNLKTNSNHILNNLKDAWRLPLKNPLEGCGKCFSIEKEKKQKRKKMLNTKALGIILGIVMLGTMAVGTASAQTAVGTGTITTVSSTSIQGIAIPPGATINLNAPGTLQILYNGTVILSGTAGTPITTTNTASFSGTLTPLNIPYNGVATITVPNTNWQLALSLPNYPGQIVTLGISGVLTIT